MFMHPAHGCEGRQKSRKGVWITAAAVVLAAGLCGCGTGAATNAKTDTPGGGGGKGGGRRGMAGDVPVTVAKATQRDVPVEIQVIGNVEAYATINVKAQVTGVLTDAFFHEGDFVHKGEKLFTIDPRPLEAAYNQALANVMRDQASLGQAQANLARDAAQLNYQDTQAKRYADLFTGGVVSKDQAEQLRASADAMAQAVNADKAAIESAKAAIAASKATADNAKVQLSYTNIPSPIDGRTGNLTVKAGNVVTANNMDLMTINQIEPTYVTFSVPESQLPSIKKYMAAGKLTVRARPQDGDVKDEDRGFLTFVDNTVDVTKGTIKL
jgi:multidrug efflux system membrane fusion protein